ncbi:hypothetical protein [Burkholderia cepacia]|uniref:hypothetical protein n=1 Tax=Burkholderia cepacia TaxID=292 RepID=UPI00299047E3|nr:hypothetical protein [Burkholderia cepacia]MDW9244537.1 hypothetical protein [Burkholderia cepacia]
MRELTTMECHEVSGGGFFGTVGAALLGATAGLVAGGFKGAATGGSQGGILGLGILSAGVGLIAGAALGVIGGNAYGLVNGVAQTLRIFNRVMEGLFDPNLPAQK